MQERPDIELTLSTEDLCFVIVKARAFDVKELPSGLTPGSNAADDGMASVLEMRGDDPAEEELRAMIDGMNEDQQIDLVAMAWLGRGDYDLSEWDDARKAASDARSAREGSAANYLLGLPLLADYIEEAMSQLGLSCEGEEMGRL